MKVILKATREYFNDDVVNNVSNVKTNFFHDGGGYLTITHAEENGNVCELSIDLNTISDFEIIS
jgi:hypothetical protein